ncbi:MAG: hypothetical protein EPN97_09270 [Alphaproteobacteria bacterium]|nr:MAG: hypothetical protein EPN97_09270 [Alphaproteobacteria bacterium]
MGRSVVAGQFLAAVGLETLMERAAHAYLQHFYRKILIEYSRETRFERARLMRQSPLDYRRVRELDRALEEATERLRDLEFEQSLRK